MTDSPQLQQTLDNALARLDRLEAMEAIRRVHYAYGYFMDYCRYQDAIALFAEEGEAVFLSGVYKGHDSLRRLYQDFLGQVYTHGKQGPLYGFIADHHLMQDIITLSEDGNSAHARGRCYITLGSHESRPDMPEVLPRQAYEEGLYENTYIRENGVWKIQRLEYALQWQALYEKGWTHTTTDLQVFTDTYPDNPIGPDYLLEKPRSMWPHRTALPFHYLHPVTGQPLK